MKLELGTIYVIMCTNGRKFCAKCIEQNDSHVTFEASNGLLTQHHNEDIISARKVI